jgi:hypothetical protein
MVPLHAPHKLFPFSSGDEQAFFEPVEEFTAACGRITRAQPLSFGLESFHQFRGDRGAQPRLENDLPEEALPQP